MIIGLDIRSGVKVKSRGLHFPFPQNHDSTMETAHLKEIIRFLLQKLPFIIPLFRGIQGLLAMPAFIWNYFQFRKLEQECPCKYSSSFWDLYPCLTDATVQTPFDGHYLYHSAWAARILKRIKPAHHVDVSSDVQLIAVISAFFPVEFHDIRPAKVFLSDLTCHKNNLLALSFETSSVKSLSCLHVVEHVGLGRYGDQMDPAGDIKAIHELKRILAPGGDLLFAVPVGKPAVKFNGHRIYSFEQIRSCFSDFELVEWSLIPDNAHEIGMIDNPGDEIVNMQKFGCGCFWWRKPVKKEAHDYGIMK